mmetsp:Transcript_5307/g.7642  ORF Transcript_5307/g.7642 Transcript_5307/m.7642 type:complete len:94 (-) Transcript_5307:112-393(-)
MKVTNVLTKAPTKILEVLLGHIQMSYLKYVPSGAVFGKTTESVVALNGYIRIGPEYCLLQCDPFFLLGKGRRCHYSKIAAGKVRNHVLVTFYS